MTVNYGSGVEVDDEGVRRLLTQHRVSLRILWARRDDTPSDIADLHFVQALWRRKPPSTKAPYEL